MRTPPAGVQHQLSFYLQVQRSQFLNSRSAKRRRFVTKASVPNLLHFLLGFPLPQPGCSHVLISIERSCQWTVFASLEELGCIRSSDLRFYGVCILSGVFLRFRV